MLVIEGVMGCSNMGGQSATIAKRQGFVGAVVDGTVRDPEQYRGMGWPVWCRGFTPITGKWRMQTVEVNGIGPDTTLVVEAVSPSMIAFLKYGETELLRRLSDRFGVGVVASIEIKAPGRG